MIRILDILSEKFADKLPEFEFSDLLDIFELDGHEILLKVAVYVLEQTDIGGELLAAIEDGEAISGDVARDIGYAFSDKLGNIEILVSGRDVIHSEAQREIFGGLARIGRQILISQNVF